MIEKDVVSLLGNQIVQSKLNYIRIGNIDPSNLIQLPKFNTKGIKY